MRHISCVAVLRTSESSTQHPVASLLIFCFVRRNAAASSPEQTASALFLMKRAAPNCKVLLFSV